MKHRFPTVGKKPQTDLILDHLRAKQSITNVEAWNLYGVRSLTRRICDLDDVGHRFSKQPCVAPNGQRYVRYHYLGFAGLPGSTIPSQMGAQA
jgi:hypothetical protein